MSVFYDLSKTPRNILNQAIVRAIVSESNGAWFDPSDLSTLFQDAAGTIPVTAVEQPVGKMLDKSGNGYHATQSITASRPTLSARYNLLTRTEDFSNAAWIKSAGGSGTTPIITNNYGVAPDGTQTASRLQLNKGVGTATTDVSQLYQSCEQLLNAYYSRSVYVKLTSGAEQKTIFVDSIGGLGAGQAVIVTNEWKLVDLYVIAEVTATRGLRLMCRGGYGTSDSADILIWHPQVQLAPIAGQYQRVNTATDYDTDERYFKKFLRFDGVDDYLNLPYMGLYANGSASVVMARDMITTSSVYGITEGSTLSNAPFYVFDYRGSISSGVWMRNDANVEIINTLSANGNVTSNNTIVSYVDTGASVARFNNSQLVDYDTYSRAGNLALNSTTIGALVRPSVTGFTPLKLYGLIITKSALTDSQRVACERFEARKSGVAL